MVPTPRIVSNTSLKLLASTRQSALYEVATETGYVLGAPLVAHLKGDNRTVVGYDAGFLLGHRAQQGYEDFMAAMFGGKDNSTTVLIEKFTDFLWSEFLTRQLPPEYDQELDAAGRGGDAAGVPRVRGADVGQLQRRFITLGSLPADPVNIVSLLEQELEEGLPRWLARSINDARRSCPWNT